MRSRSLRALSITAAVGVAASLGIAAVPAAAEEDPYKVLVVGKTLGFRHSHIDDTTNAVTLLGQQNGFTVDVWDPAQASVTLPSTPFTTTADLQKYATIIFASPVDGTNNMDPARPRLLNDSELAAFQGYIRSGGGFVGLHAATDAMHAVPWYSQLTGGGARFRNHPQQQTATMRVENPTHPSTTMLPAEWVRFDEWYNFTTNPREDVHVLITLDESTYNPGNGRMGADHPLAWCKNFEGGRSWYEGAGHTDASWTDPLFLSHILKGIEWTAGLVTGGGDCVTFREVGGILDGVANGGNASTVAAVRAGLDAAKVSADAKDHVAAAKTLRQTQETAGALGSTTLVEKIDDLVEWQRGMSGDATGPDIRITSPAVDSVQRGNIVITGTATDAGSGIDEVTVHVRKLKDNGKLDGFLTNIEVPVLNGVWSTSVPASQFPDGRYGVTVLGTDGVGNSVSAGGAHLKSFFIDTKRPALTVDAPASVVRGAAASVALSASDGSGLNRIAANLYDANNATMLKALGSTSGSSAIGSATWAGSYALPTNLAAGEYTVRVSVSDLSGWSTTLTKKVVVTG